MGEHAEVALACAALVGAPGHGAAESPLVPAEGALGLPPLAVHAPVPGTCGAGPEPRGHLGTVFPARFTVVTARVDRDNRGPNAQHLPPEPVVRFGIECGIGQHPVPAEGQGPQEQNRCALGGVVGRAGGDRGTGDEMGVRIDRGGQLGPRPGGVLATRARDEIARRVPAIQAGGIDRDGRLFGDQAGVGCGRDGAFE